MKPADRHIAVLAAVDWLARGELGSTVINRVDAEECCTRGWLQPAGDRYELTVAGRDVLTSG